MALKKYLISEINKTIYIRTEEDDFNIETFKRAQTELNTNNPINYKSLRLAKKGDNGYEILTVGGEPVDNLEALNNLEWKEIEF